MLATYGTGVVTAALGLDLPWWAAIPVVVLAGVGVMFSLVRDRSEPPRVDGPAVREREFY